MPQEREDRPETLTERFLEDAHQHRWAVSVYLVNGFQLKGEVIEYDAESVLFKHKEVHQLINRSAIATMYPVSASKGPAAEWWKGLRREKGDREAG